MLSSLSIATRGQVLNRSPLTLATDGLICVEIISPSTGNSGGGGGRVRPDQQYRIDGDKDLIEMLTIILSCGVLD